MSRNTKELHPFLQIKINELQELCNKKGLKIGIGECFRTVKEQDSLYALGRTAAGKIVTNAKGSGYSSLHQWGIDFDFYRNDGKGAYNNTDNFFEKVGKVGQSIGLEWGGNWRSIKDNPHFQLPIYGSGSSTIKSIYASPKEFIKTWNYKPLTPVTYKSGKNDVLWLQERLSLCLNKTIQLDSVFGEQVNNGVLEYWKRLDWNIGLVDTNGYYKAGDSTIEALSSFRVR